MSSAVTVGFTDYTKFSLFHTIINPLLSLAQKKSLEVSDVGQLPAYARVSDVHERFRLTWNEELKLPREKRSIYKATLKAVGYGNFAAAFLLDVIGQGSAFHGPLLLKAIGDSNAGIKVLSPSVYWILVALTFVVPVLGVICTQQAQRLYDLMGMQTRNLLAGAIYHKTMVRKASQLETGFVTNLFVNDVKQVEHVSVQIGVAIILPAMLAVGLALIYEQVGVAMFAGIGLVVAIFFPMAINIVFMMTKFHALVQFADRRIKLTTEVMSGIRIIKYYGWEEPFRKAIEVLRVEEWFAILGVGVHWAISMIFTAGVGSIQPIIVFYTYITLGHQLDYVTAFATITLFGLIQGPINSIAFVFQGVAMAFVSMGRIQEYLEAEEMENYVIRENGDTNPYVAIQFDNASLGWLTEEEVALAAERAAVEAAQQASAISGTETDKNNTQADGEYEMVKSNEVVAAGASTAESNTNRGLNTLLNMSITVNKGQLVAVVGKIGSGKSSLLNALLGELNLQGGTVKMVGSVAYHQQQPWILNATIQENILFGLPYDPTRFRAAIANASLETDINSFPAGLETEIGEKGINLSGGQKARISFARALYRDSDIYLLDDPLSAVDAHVGDHLFNTAIRGALAGKTVILATHQVQFTKMCDCIIVLDAGNVTARGTYEELLAKGIDVEGLVSTPKDDEDEDEIEEGQNAGTTTTAAEATIASEVDAAVIGDIEDKGAAGSPRTRQLSRATSGRTRSRTKSFSTGSASADEKEKKEGVLMEEEEKEEGLVNFSIFWYFVSAGSALLLLGSVIFSFGGQVSNIAASYWLRDWGQAVITSYVEQGRPLNNTETMVYVRKFAWLMMIPVGGTFISAVFGVMQTTIAGGNFHTRLIGRIMGAPVAFFDTTPLGRIINRFSNDQRKVDLEIAPAITMLINALAAFLGCVGAIAYATKGTFLLVLVPVGVFYYAVQKVYRKANIDVVRLNNVAKSPVLIGFSQLLQGVTSVRGYGMQQHFISNMEAAVNDESATWIMQMLLRIWLQLRLGIMGATLAFFLFLLQSFDKNFLTAGNAALALSYCFQIPLFCGQVLQCYAQVEGNLNSVERMRHYITTTDVEETPFEIANHVDVPESWPSEGKIEFSDVVMGYRDGPPVLKGVSFGTMAHEKIGVVGRTGSGKSTLMVALFRIEKLRSGEIFIDGIDIGKVPLIKLRKKLGIIPQDPVMFSATLRFNLDPFEEHSDATLWEVLDIVNMKEDISNLSNKLLEKVAEGGSNFSSGQRQLICFARALLRKPKILVLDEATASVDNQTDSLIQKMIRDRFANSTVLTIAHRLNTIVDSDRICVLDGGKLAEFDAPPALLAAPGGLFAGLWAQFEQSHEASAAANASEKPGWKSM